MQILRESRAEAETYLEENGFVREKSGRWLTKDRTARVYRIFPHWAAVIRFRVPAFRSAL